VSSKRPDSFFSSRWLGKGGKQARGILHIEIVKGYSSFENALARTEKGPKKGGSQRKHGNIFPCK